MCVKVQTDTAARLVPGAVPSEIYGEIMSRLDSEFLEHFMDMETEGQPFLGTELDFTLTDSRNCRGI
jgi:hypothetical protein